MCAEGNMDQMAAVPIDTEGESAPSESQVSPDKLYRAVLLRSRFADTILNAQVKTNGKVEKQDIERSRLEKEELKKRRKEKARLLAKATATEEALRNAELEAVAKPKRKRELEREAGPFGFLQKTEMMVEINDNSQFPEDLEMLNIATVEPLQSFIDETSVDCCQDPLLGSFNFQGKGNALEKLVYSCKTMTKMKTLRFSGQRKRSRGRRN